MQTYSRLTECTVPHYAVACKLSWLQTSCCEEGRENDAARFPCSEDMDLSALQQQILSSNKTASEKAKGFLLKSKVNDLSKDEWRQLIAGIPEEVEEEIGILKSAGTYLHLQEEIGILKFR